MKAFSHKYLYSLILVMLATILWLASPSYSQKTSFTEEYQAVFLTNGQVYFGQISSLNKKFLTLENVYYFQGNQQADQESTTQDLKLVKLGTELHGPTDQMKVILNNVLFIEDLRDESKVVESIKSSI